MTDTSRYLCVLFTLAISAIPASAGSVRTLSNFQAATLPKGDDLSSPAVPLGFTINAAGWFGSSVFVDTNGAVTFNSPYIGYPGAPLGDNLAGGPIPPLGAGTQPLICAFLSDIDTTAPAAGAITYGTATVNGRPAFAVNYLNVTHVSFSPANFDLRRNSFQIVLLERSDTGAGNFDIEFNYDQIQWETADSNGGASGLGGYAALVGYSNGARLPGTFYSLPGSGVPGSFADGAALSLVAGSQNSGVAGRYVFAIRNTIPPAISSLNPATVVAAGPAFSLTVNGSGFAANSTVQWNASPVPTAFLSATQLTATIAPGLIASPGAAIVVVSTGAVASNTGSVTITAPPAPTSSVNPAAGAGINQTFSLVYSDPNGNANIRYVSVLFQTALAAEASCFLQYTPATNSLALVADSGSGYVGSAALGVAGVLSNSQCAVNLAASSATASGNNLTVNLALTFTGAFAGNKTVFTTLANNTNGFYAWQPKGIWTVPAGGAVPPVNVSVTPSSGSGANQTFRFVYSDPNGAANISSMNVLIHDQIAADGACFVQYTPAANSLTLVRDSGSGYVGSAWMGAPGALSNSQCVLDAWASSASVSGTNLTLTLALTFKSAFSGAKNIYMSAANNSDLFSGWQPKGAWTVADSLSPGSISVSPASGAQAIQTFAFVYSSAAAIGFVNVLIHNQIAAPNSCFVQFTPATNTLVLVEDSGSGYVGSALLGSPGLLNNSQCSLDAGTSSASVAGNELTLNLSLAFTPAFTGPRTIYMGAMSNAASPVFSGWQGKGAWIAP